MVRETCLRERTRVGHKGVSRRNPGHLTLTWFPRGLTSMVPPWPKCTTSRAFTRPLGETKAQRHKMSSPRPPSWWFHDRVRQTWTPRSESWQNSANPDHYRIPSQLLHLLRKLPTNNKDCFLVNSTSTKLSANTSQAENLSFMKKRLNHCHQL